MRYQRDDGGHERIATIDIETTHFDPTHGETVAIGLGVHDRDTPASEASYELHHQDTDTDEATLIERALTRLDDLGADLLVTYKGSEFDMAFLNERLTLLGADELSPAIDTPDTHLDLFTDRKEKANRTNEKWPKLEECLESYGLPTPTTVWNGQPVTNTVFGEELGPAYLEAVAEGAADRVTALKDPIEHYLMTDLEANLALYYADVGVAFDPAHLASRREFHSGG
ncbi:ribonuclease H-like domain-containing protein [Salinilacihabitans rarus]|uniref:ribonuclease H-like domain-containing protein n=1 Tax=Salinilacihabitans rarus TaxID=2961596 RepID=UPI0020C842F5|nr:ribonuclease H-like domain-containing protein [Salinilacihabitans rarus]